MKTFLKIVAGLAVLGLVLGAIVVALVFHLTADLTKTADDFFAAVKAHDTAKATEYLSESFRTSTPPRELAAFLERSGLTRFKSASWSNRSFSGNRGDLDGSITTETGGVIPIKIGLVKENGAWRINTIEKANAGLTGGAEAAAFPSGADLDALVQDSIHQFALSVNARDFSSFHDQIARVWQQQITIDKLNDVFKPFMDAKMDLTVVDHMTPNFDGPPVTADNGVVSVSGSYPTKPSRVLFDLGYVHESAGWKLVNINIRVKPMQEE